MSARRSVSFPRKPPARGMSSAKLMSDSTTYDKVAAIEWSIALTARLLIRHRAGLTLRRPQVEKRLRRILATWLHPALCPAFMWMRRCTCHMRRAALSSAMQVSARPTNPTPYPISSPWVDPTTVWRMAARSACGRPPRRYWPNRRCGGRFPSRRRCGVACAAGDGRRQRCVPCAAKTSFGALLLLPLLRRAPATCSTARWAGS